MTKTGDMLTKFYMVLVILLVQLLGWLQGGGVGRAASATTINISMLMHLKWYEGKSVDAALAIGAVGGVSAAGLPCPFLYHYYAAVVHYQQRHSD